MGIEVIRLSEDSAIGPRENERIIHELLQRRDVASELSLSEGRLGGAQGSVGRVS